MKLTVGRIVQVKENDAIAGDDWKAALVTHVYPWGALVRVFFSTPVMDRVVQISDEPGGTRYSDGVPWVWRWPPRE